MRRPGVRIPIPPLSILSGLEILCRGCIYQGSKTAVNHNTDTPAQFTAVPGHTRLFRRESGTYYFRAKVPQPLRKIVGKTEIRVSLRTKEYKKAVSAVKIESLRVDREFAQAEADLNGERRPLRPLSGEEIRWFVSKSFVDLELNSMKLVSRTSASSDSVQREYLVENLEADLMVLLGSPSHSDYTDDFTRQCVNEEMRRWEIPEGSDSYERAFPLFRAAVVEHHRRMLARAKGEAPQRQEFRDLSESTILPARPRSTVTVGQLLEEFTAHQKSARRSTTLDTYQVAMKALREEIGVQTPLSSITKQDVEKVMALMERIPTNAMKRYRGLTLRQAAERAVRDKLESRLSPQTLRNFFVRISAVLNFGVQEGYITENPAKSRTLREAFRKGPRRKRRAMFSDDELTRLFKAPIYRGCKDDEYGFAISGPNHPRRGRFWVPLLSLFQGFRLNEACQLYASDVGIENGIPFIEIRAWSEESQTTDKRLKTEASERRVPVHPELVKLGFMEFVAERKKDRSSPRLFPELRMEKSRGLYSHDFSKWFRRFVRLTCGEETSATFHSLRHNFRTALMNAEVSTELVEALGGWSVESSSEREYRHYQLPVLLTALEKVKYSSVNLETLYSPTPDDRP